MTFLKKSLLALSLVCAPATLVVATDADAACCVAYDYNDIKGREKNIIETIVTQIDVMNLALMETIRLSTGQLSANNKEQIGASSNIANVQDDREVVGRGEMARLNAIMAAQPPASSCGIVTGATVGGSLSGGAKDFAIANVQQMLETNLGEPGSPAADGADVYTTRRLKAHCDLYATEGDVLQGLCERPAPREMRGASLNVSQSLFYSPSGQSGMTQSEDRARATQAFIANTFGGNPMGPMLPDEASTPGGREKAARRQNLAGAATIAYDSVQHVASIRAPQNSPQMASWIRSVGPKIAGYRNTTTEGDIVSYADYMDVNAKNFFFNSNELIANLSFNEAAALKQLVLIESFRAYLDWEKFKQGEKQTVTLASILQIMVDERAERLAN